MGKGRVDTDTVGNQTPNITTNGRHNKQWRSESVPGIPGTGDLYWEDEFS